MEKRKWGDRKDGCLVRDLDGIHLVTPVMYPNRTDNEAFISECMDLTKVLKYIDKKNEGGTELKYTFFQFIVAATLKTVVLRPKLNRFIQNGNIYQRNEITASFIVKKKFSDDSGEGIAFVKAKPESTFDDIHDDIQRQVITSRSDKSVSSTDDALDILTKVPRPLAKGFVRFVCWLDKHGWVPKSLINGDPYYASVIFSNLGSIKLHAGYHHLGNWGTTSIFVVVGERKMRPFYNDDGSFEMKDSVDLGLTIDERIADGYYFSKTIQMIRDIFDNPEILDKPLREEI